METERHQGSALTDASVTTRNIMIKCKNVDRSELSTRDLKRSNRPYCIRHNFQRVAIIIIIIITLTISNAP